MPSKKPPPVLHDWAGWSPYQQQTLAARVIESPIPAMLSGRGGEADAAGSQSRTATTAASSVLRRCMRRPVSSPQSRFDTALVDDRVGLELDEPARIDEARDDDVGVRGPDVGEDLAVGARHLLEEVGARGEDARAN